MRPKIDYLGLSFLLRADDKALKRYWLKLRSRRRLRANQNICIPLELMLFSPRSLLPFLILGGVLLNSESRNHPRLKQKGKRMQIP